MGGQNDDLGEFGFLSFLPKEVDNTHMYYMNNKRKFLRLYLGSKIVDNIKQGKRFDIGKKKK